MFSFNTIKTSKDLSFEFLERIHGENAQGNCGILSVKKTSARPEAENGTIVSPRESMPDNNFYDENINSRDLLIDSKSNVVLYKFGNTGYNCTLSRTEFIISMELTTKCNHLPYFERPLFYLKNFLVGSKPNPFDISKSKNIMCADVVIFEYIQHDYSFHKMIKSKNFSDQEILSIFCQIMLCIICAQQTCDFVHNDLHTDNILIIKCDKNLVVHFKLELNKKVSDFYICTHGYLPIIIDYGFAYSKECENMSLETADFDQHGLITYKFDEISDFIRLFCAFAKDFKRDDIVEFVGDLFENLPIDTKKGFETLVKRSSSDFCESIFLKTHEDVFGRTKKQWIYVQQISKLLMRLIVLPLKINGCVDENSYVQWMKSFWKEWHEIDKWCSFEYQRVYIFREMIDTIRKYEDEQKTKHRVLDCFKELMPETIISLDVNFKNLLKSTIMVAKITENNICKRINRLQKQRNAILYSKLESGERMVENMLDLIYEKNQTIKKGSAVLFIDNINKENSICELDEDLVF